MTTEAVEPEAKCWICGVNDANSGEHSIKKSDLRKAMGKPTQRAPFYFYKPGRPAKHVGSLNADVLKSSAPMCEHCNTTRTQPHDLAWEAMSDWLSKRSKPLRNGQFIRANEIFEQDVWQKLRGVHLFFVKTLGCLIVEAGDQAPIDITPFSNAIMNGRTHPEVYIQFCCGDESVGRRFDCRTLDIGGHVFAFAVLTYRIRHVTINIIYAQDGLDWESLDQVWHPRFSTKRFLIGDYTRGSASQTEPSRLDTVPIQP
jgi:hypothetical protein